MLKACKILFEGKFHEHLQPKMREMGVKNKVPWQYLIEDTSYFNPISFIVSKLNKKIIVHNSTSILYIKYIGYQILIVLCNTIGILISIHYVV